MYTQLLDDMPITGQHIVALGHYFTEAQVASQQSRGTKKGGTALTPNG